MYFDEEMESNMYINYREREREREWCKVLCDKVW